MHTIEANAALAATDVGNRILSGVAMGLRFEN